jgi:hypothetical protein
MNAFLSHIDMGPLFYGVILAIGIIIVFIKLITGAWQSLAIEVFIFWAVFSMHKGTLTGGMAAAVASSIAANIIVLILLLRRA